MTSVVETPAVETNGEHVAPSTDLVPVEPEVQGEIVSLTKAEAKSLDKKIVAASDKVGNATATLGVLMRQAAEGQIHTFFEFPSLSAYFNDRINFAPSDVDERKIMAKIMDGAGLTQRAIASVLNVGVGTVNRDLAEAEADASVPHGTVDESAGEPTESEPVTKTGRDGKDRPAKQPAKERANTSKQSAVTSISVLMADMKKDVTALQRRKSFTDKELDALSARVGDLRDIALSLQGIIKEHTSLA